MRSFYCFLADESGPTAVEYAIIAAVVLGAILGSLNYVMQVGILGHAPDVR
jgi:Flp pilus assembly pilin Flp